MSSEVATSSEFGASDEQTTGATRRRMLTGIGAVAGAGLVAAAGTSPAQAAPTDGGLFFSITPLRLIDTRTEGGPISLGQTRLVPLIEAQGVTLYFNITVANTAGNGYLAVFDADGSRPSPFSSVNWQGAGKIVANFGLVSLGTAGFNVYCGGGAGSRTNFIIDIVGASEAPPAAAAAKGERLRRRLEAARAG